MSPMKVLCFDLSASSGRFIAVSFIDGKIDSEETYRFPNHPVEKQGHLYWDIDAIEKEFFKGLQASFSLHPDIESVGVDTFGVDYLRLGEGGFLLSAPFAYRDPRCLKAMEEVLSRIPYSKIYQNTGIQCLPFNTIFQLCDDAAKCRELGEILFLPDYFNYLLTGVKATERTIASTGAILSLDHEFDASLLESLGIAPDIFAPLSDPSSTLGSVKEDLAKKLGIPRAKVILTASHDTASAIAAIDLDPSTAYLSSGTWSLLGVETRFPIVTKESEESNFTNELGLHNTNRFLKNIMGLFIIQELVNGWKVTDPRLDFATLALEAEEATALPYFIDVDDPVFSTPMDMEEKFYRYLKKTKQESGVLTRGEIARIVYESMAFAYKKHFDSLQQILKKTYGRLVVVGGGSKADLLNRFIADALQVKVETGQCEATVYGNAIAQFLGLDPRLSWEELRKAAIPKNRRTYLPSSDLSPRYQRYLDIIHRRK